ncbi:MAG: glycosyltransferase 87 family protein [Methanomassiliicoccales archaeon]
MRDDELFTPAGLRRLASRFSYIALSITFITISSLIWSDFGYLDLGMLIPAWIILVLAGTALIVGASGELTVKLEKYFVLFLLPGIAAFFAVLVQKFPVYGTDELAIDTYSAYLFLHGIDPYINSNMVSVFTFYNVPKYLITPIRTGGYVTYLTYPGLSALLFIPSLVFGLQSNLVLIAFDILSFIVLYWRYRQTGLASVFPYAAFLLLIDINWIYYSVGGVTDIVWVVLLALSFIYRRHTAVSGAFFGFAVAFKQTPAVVLPFFLYFIYREGGKSVRKAAEFLFWLLIFFLIPNLPFIFMSPSAWIHNVAGVATQPIVGIGMGPSIISFANMAAVAPMVFYALPALIGVFLLALYIRNYDRMKYTFFAIPILPFIFYYRLLLNYILYWPYLILILLPELLIYSKVVDVKRTVKAARSIRVFLANKRFEAVLLSGVVLASGAVSAYGVYTASSQPFRIMGVGGFSDPVFIPGVITEMNVTIKYSPLNGESVYQQVNFRIFQSGAIVNANGLLWTAQNPVLEPGVNNLTLLPNTNLDFLQQGVPFRLIAYYGNYQASLSMPAVKLNNTIAFVNPYLIDPVQYPTSNAPPGWDFAPNQAAGKAYATFTDDQVTLTAVREHAGTGWATSQIYNSEINMTVLASKGYLLTYRLLFGSDSYIEESNLTAAGFPNVFYGVQIGIDNGTRQIWIGYNASVPFERVAPSNTMIVVITNSLVVNFSWAMNQVIQAGWPLHGSQYFSYLAGSYTINGTFSATFNSFSLEPFRQ